MRLATLLGPDLKAAIANDPDALKEALEEFHPEDIAEIVEDLTLEDTLALFRALPDDFAAEVLERLPTESQTEILELLSTREAAELLSEMSPDDRADVVQELEETRASELIAHLEQHEPEVAEEVRELSAYDEDVAGGLMTTDYVALQPDVKIWQAIEEVRRLSHEEEVETVYYIYVIYGQKLVGVVSLRDLILSDPGQTLGDIMTENVVTVRATDDQEEVARTIAKYDFSAVPVVDEHGNLLGVVTVDDVVDVVIEEATEDVHRMGAVSPIEEGYFDAPLWRAFRSRVVWLILLFIGGFLTASVMELFQGAAPHGHRARGVRPPHHQRRRQRGIAVRVAGHPRARGRRREAVRLAEGARARGRHEPRARDRARRARLRARVLHRQRGRGDPARRHREHLDARGRDRGEPGGLAVAARDPARRPRPRRELDALHRIARRRRGPLDLPDGGAHRAALSSPCRRVRNRAP
ncbi:MAG: magnesium transporter [Sandaracinaceae bacterium]|nr:magnesium transporter [Sandaracinaceae bacterium]